MNFTSCKIEDKHRNFLKFSQGDEKGLEYFYNRYYPSLFYKRKRYIKDEINADCIVNDAFLRLWLIRNTIIDPDHIETFLSKTTLDACKAYYRTSRNNFQRNMLMLDDIENYQKFMAGYDPEDELDHEDIMYQEEMDERLKLQWQQVETVIPNLTENQQLFIKLCLKYTFNYERIASHIGGISDYQVGKTVEKILETIKNILTSSQKLDDTGKSGKFKFEGDLCEEQSRILHMRYELQYSFEEIASQLNLSEEHIKRTFVEAYTKVKTVKK
ncbi:sigma-70 family RNA polymerase sigma factor [Pedobacter panaciterrae]|uniref:sigma-70 family RNA polymerase sigma factor n=1 Tax=Pedobacter panaciterrae TaxID=363849 RepID=UPI00155DDC39|nr:sigma-70 family RNA polymerase sigma factor [Pedobacter panaciterrae]NQX52270.1 sigma-70 family RNA polymerase sigma factor [Pedobacter panaciterrae]